MTNTREKIYTASDLNTAARREFIDEALRGEATLRATTGESLVMLRSAKLEHLAATRDYALAYLMLHAAMSRPREERRPSDFGSWAFVAAFDDDDIIEFQGEINDAIVRAVSGQDHTQIEAALEDWRRSARTLSDPIAREILEGRVNEDDWVAVGDE